MTHPENADRCAIAVMAKQSIPGRVKTRLAPELGVEGAAALNTAFLTDVTRNVATAAITAAIDGFLSISPAGSEAFFGSIVPPRFGFVTPAEAGIGRALPLSAQLLLDQGYGAVCLINADSPNLPPAYLTEAASRLASPGDRLVLGPSEDGGYYLIGLKRMHRRLFEEIAWSTEDVQAQTLDRAREIGLDTVLLPAWYDVDEAPMLRRLMRDLLGDPPVGFAPATTALLHRFVRDGRIEPIAASGHA